MKSFINVYSKSSTELIHKFIENGVRKQKIVRYQPILGYKVNKPTEWHDIFGNNIETIRFDSMAEAYSWKKENKNMFDIYGDINFNVAFLAEEYPDDIEIQKNQMNIYSFDIEAFSLDIVNTPEPIRSITFHNMVKDKYYVFGLKEFNSTETNVSYYKCSTEESLLENVVDFFNRQDIDILSGFNIDGYDIGYLYNRIKKILGEDKANSISPIKKISKTTKMINKNYVEVYRIEGIICWDFRTLYIKFTKDNREKYSLDYLSHFELGENKVEYEGTLEQLYERDHQKFIEYNIHDCRLVYLLDKKLNYINNAISYAYMAKCEPQNIFGTTNPWDALLYSESIKENLICPPNRHEHKVEFEGGYVKEPNKGLRFWNLVVDIVSSYPNQIRSYGLSPETIVSESFIEANPELQKIRKKYYGVTSVLDIDNLNDLTEVLQKFNLTYTSNGNFFTKEKQGIIPKIVGKLFAERIAIKKLMKNATKEEYVKLDNKQYTLKIFLNSIFGAMASEYFRYYDIRIAEAITWQGQVSTRGAIAYLITKVPDIVWDYGDTDSLMINLSKVVDKRYKGNFPLTEEIVKFILKYQDRIIEPNIKEFFSKLKDVFNILEMTIEMETEGIADTALFIEKKKYCMSYIYADGKWFLDKPKIKIKGIEVVRTSTPAVVRKRLEEALYIILSRKTNEDVINLVSNFKKEFFNLSYDEIASPRGVNIDDKHHLNYKSLPIQVRAALLYNKALDDFKLPYDKIRKQDKIKFCYIKEPNIFKSNVIGCLDKMPTELLVKFQIDYDTQWEKTFLNPITKILDTIGWKVQKNYSSLSEFF